MAEVKNYGLSGVHRTLQLGKQGPVLVGNADTDSFSVTLQDGATLTNMGGANATSGTHFITKSQLDAVYTEATFLANVNYNSSSPILLGNISYGTKTIITTFEVTSAFDANAVVTIGDSSDNSLLMSDNYAEIEVPGTYQTVNVVEFENDSTLNIYVTQGGATQGAGAVLVSVVDGPVVNGGAINYGAGGGGITLSDLSVTTASPSGNGSLSYDNTTGVFTFTPANVGSESGGGYKGFKAHYGRMWDNNDDPNGPINKIVIYKDTVSPSSTIDTSTNQDDFMVSGLTGSDVVAMLVAIGENINQTSTAELKTFTESIIDNVILDGGVEGQINNAADMRSAFYSNFNTFSSVLTDLKTNLDFFDTNNLDYNIINSNSIVNSGSGSGWYWYSIRYNINTSQLEMGSGSTGVPGGFQVGDTLTILGTNLQDYQGNTLASPANDLVITVNSIDGQGIPQSYTITGTVPYTTPGWPNNSISDGGDDEYDTANYINTDLESQISYNSGNVVTSSSAFGGGDYVVTYQSSIFGVFAVNAAIDSIATNGNSGFDGDGQADTGALYSASASNNTIGDITVAGTALKTDNGTGPWYNGIISLMPGSNNEPQYATYGQFINVYPTWNFDQPHIHIAAGTGANGTGDLILGDDNYHIDINHNGSIYIKTNSQNNTWQFGENGTLYAPGQVEGTRAYFNDVVVNNASAFKMLYTTGGREIYDTNFGYDPDTGAISGIGNITTTGNITAANLGNVSSLALNGNASTVLAGNGTWIAATSSSNYSNSNVVTLLSSFGSNTISTTGNITGGYFIGNGALLTGITASSSNYSDSNVVTLLSSFGSNSFSTTGNVTAGNITTAAGKSVILGNASSKLTQAGSNATVILSGSVALTPDIAASSLNGVLIGGNGYLLGGNGARNLTLNYSATSGWVGVQANLTVGSAGQGGTTHTTGNATTGITSIVAGVTNTQLPNTIASFSANVNNYTQVTLQNKNTGGDATADFIITADNGSDTVNYADFGIINSGYDNTTPSNSLGNIVFAADTYLYAQGNASNTSQPGGNLAIGTATVGKTVKVFAGGANSNSVIGTFSNTGLAVNGNVSATNFSGNISITGNVTGTSPNVSLVAGSHTTLFDNTGLATFPGNVTINGAAAGYAPNRPAFRVYGSGTTNNLSTTTNTNGVLNSNNFAVDYNQGSYLNTSTGTFTAPCAGLYQVSLVARVSNNNNTTSQIAVMKNGSTQQAFWEVSANSTVGHMGVSSITKLAAGDTLTLKVILGTINFDTNDSWSVAYLG